MSRDEGYFNVYNAYNKNALCQIVTHFVLQAL